MCVFFFLIYIFVSIKFRVMYMNTFLLFSCYVVSNSFVTPWTIAHQAPLSMEFSRQEYWSGLPFPAVGDLPDPGIEPTSPPWQADSLPLSHLGSPYEYIHIYKGPYSQSYGFSSSHVWMWELTIKKAEHRRIDVFELWCWRRLLRVLWTARRSNQSVLKEINPEHSLKGLSWNWSSNTLATWYEELTLWKRPWCWERLTAGGEGDNRGRDGWMASPIQWTWVWASSGRSWRTGKPGMLQSMRSQRIRLDWVSWTMTTTIHFSLYTLTDIKYIYVFNINTLLVLICLHVCLCVCVCVCEKCWTYQSQTMGGSGCYWKYNDAAIKSSSWKFPGSSVVRSLCFHCQGPESNPWSGN